MGSVVPSQESRELITVRQVPVIEDNLLEARKAVEVRVAEALSMACTEETYKAVKKVRSDLRKEYADLEVRRKAVKAAILAPYEQFETLYAENIGNYYTDADKKLKARIDEVEDGLREQKATVVRAHFDQCMKTFGIETGLTTFERSGIKVTLSAGTEALKTKATEYLSRIAGDLELIAAQEHRDEVMAEYRQTLDVTRAVLTVKERHEAAERERQRREAEAMATEKAVRENTTVSLPAANPPTTGTPFPPSDVEQEQNVPFASDSAPVSDVLPFMMDMTGDASVPFGQADFPESSGCVLERKTYTLRVTAMDEEMDRLRGFLTSGGYQFTVIA